MHYPHRISKVKCAGKIGFRARMSTKKGRQMINRKSPGRPAGAGRLSEAAPPSGLSNVRLNQQTRRRAHDRARRRLMRACVRFCAC